MIDTWATLIATFGTVGGTVALLLLPLFWVLLMLPTPRRIFLAFFGDGRANK